MPSDCAMWLDLACIKSILCQSSKCVLTKPLYKSLIFVFIKIFRDFHFLETSSYKFSKKVGLLTSKLPGSITILSSCILTQNCQLSLLRKIKFKLSLREVKYPVKKLTSTTGTYYYDVSNPSDLMYRIDRANGVNDRYCGLTHHLTDQPCNQYVKNGDRYLYYP